MPMAPTAATTRTVRLPTATAAKVTMLTVSMLTMPMVHTQTPPDTSAKKVRFVMAHAQKAHPRRVSVVKALVVQVLVPELARALGPHKLLTSPC